MTCHNSNCRSQLICVELHFSVAVRAHSNGFPARASTTANGRYWQWTRMMTEDKRQTKERTRWKKELRREIVWMRQQMYLKIVRYVRSQSECVCVLSLFFAVAFNCWRCQKCTICCIIFICLLSAEVISSRFLKYGILLFLLEASGFALFGT